MNRRHGAAFVGSVVLSCAGLGCGDPTNELTEGRQPAPPRAGTTTTLPVQARLVTTTTQESADVGDPETPPPPPDPNQLINLNDASSPMGKLCWARREVVLSVRRQVNSRIDGRELSAAEVQADYVEPLSTLDTISDTSLPAIVRPFKTHFQQALRTALAAPPDSGDSLDTDTFAFDAYPAAQTYIQVANQEPDCAQV